MFTFNAAGKPIFFIASNIFVRKSKGYAVKTSLAGSRPNGKLNLSKVAKETSQPKGVIEEVMRCVIETFTVMVNKGRGKSARLSFNPVGEVTCNNLKIGSTYFNDFLARQGAARLNPRNLARLGVQPALSTFAERVKRDAAEVQSTRASSIRSAKSRAQSRSVSQRSGSIHSRGQVNNDKYSLKSDHVANIHRQLVPRDAGSQLLQMHTPKALSMKVKAAIIRRGGHMVSMQ